MNVTIDGHGTYTVTAEKAQELIAWLTQNGAKVQENFTAYDGKELLNENFNIISNAGANFKPTP